MAKRKPKADEAEAKPYDRTPQEIEGVAAQRDRRKARPKAPRAKIDGFKKKVAQVVPDHPDPVVWQALIEQTFGTASHAAVNLLMSSALGVVWPNPDEPSEPAFNAVLGLLYGISPADEIEGMLVAQMIGLHLASMDCLKRAQLSGQTFEARDMNLKHASRLSRTFACQVEALKRYRTGGHQKVTVEHVTVNQGGQAIVGNITQQGGGGLRKTEDQPDATEPQSIAHVAGAEMPSQVEAERATVPRAGGQG